MKLISFNVGIKIDNSKQIGEFIKSQKPDFVALQEVIKHHEDLVPKIYRSKEDIEKMVGEKLPNRFFGPLFLSDAYMNKGKVHRDFGGLIEQGSETLSKFSIIEATNEFFYKKYIKGPLDLDEFFKEDLARSLVIAEFDVNGKRLQILNLHGIWTKDKKGNENTTKQCKYILSAAKRKNIPTIIVGDFNLLPETEGIKLIEKEFRNLIKEFNIKITRPLFEDEVEKGGNVIDYVFVNKEIKVNDFKVIKTDISDHYPLVLDFDFLK